MLDMMTIMNDGGTFESLNFSSECLECLVYIKFIYDLLICRHHITNSRHHIKNSRFHITNMRLDISNMATSHNKIVVTITPSIFDVLASFLRGLSECHRTQSIVLVAAVPVHVNIG